MKEFGHSPSYFAGVSKLGPLLFRCVLRLFRGLLLPLHDVYNGTLVHIVMKYMHDLIHLGLFVDGMKIVCISSIKKIPYSGHFVFQGMIRIHGDDGISGCSFSVDVVRKARVRFF